MRKLEEFKDESSLAINELLNINGGKVVSRYTCWEQTASQNCTDSRCESTLDHSDGSSTTTITETDN